MAESLRAAGLGREVPEHAAIGPAGLPAGGQVLLAIEIRRQLAAMESAVDRWERGGRRRAGDLGGQATMEPAGDSRGALVRHQVAEYDLVAAMKPAIEQREHQLG
jgi:hypothetical protein